MIEEVIRVLERVKRCAGGYVALCPAHSDKTPSLSFTERDDKLLFRCFNGCSYESIREALERRGVKLKQNQADQVETVYEIRDRDGNVVAQKARIDTVGIGKKVYWRGPQGQRASLKDLGLKVTELPLYGSERLSERPDTPVILVEGEKSAAALWVLGALGLGTVTGASTNPSKSVLSTLVGRKVFLWADNDDEGEKHMNRIGLVLGRLGIEFYNLKWEGAPKKGDAADFVALGGDRGDLGRMAQEATDAGQPEVKGKSKLMSEGMAEAAADIARYEAKDFSRGVRTGIGKLDIRLEGGLRRGGMTLLGAPTGGGKTTIVTQIAMAAAEQGSVLIVSPEMSLVSLAEREIIRRSRRQRWDRNPYQSGGYFDNRKESARTAHEAAVSEFVLKNLPVYIMDSPDTTVEMIADEAESMKGLVLVVIDYAQQVAGDIASRIPRYLQVGDVGRASVDLAMKLDIPVLLASQVNVNKEADDITDKYAFRETAILSQKAHAIIVLDVEWAWDQKEGRRLVSSAEIVCVKNRSGATFRFPVKYEPELYSVLDLKEAADAAIADQTVQQAEAAPPERLLF